MPGGFRDKHKGEGGWSDRPGLGRLRRANIKEGARQGRWEDKAGDDAALDRIGSIERASHAGESLLAKFNRLARDASDEGGEPGEVCGFDGTRVLVRLAVGGEVACAVRRVLKKMASGVKNPICIGDRVRIAREGEPVIVAIAPRRTQLARADSHNRSLEQVIAANVDALVVVASLADPLPRPALIDRYLVIAGFNGIDAVVVFNKADLGDGGDLPILYRSLGIETHVVSAMQGMDDRRIAALRERLVGRACVVAGQSGVGKSSLVNVLYPRAGARVGLVADEGHGRHTTTAARSWMMPGGGRLIDTPGIRECALAGLTPLDVALLYPELAALHPQCRFRDCTHRHEPDCAVCAAVDDGRVAASRYDSYRAIIDEDLAGG